MLRGVCLGWDYSFCAWLIRFASWYKGNPMLLDACYEHFA